MSLDQPAVSSELAYIDQALRPEDALLIFPNQNGGFTVATIRDPEGKTQQNLAREPTALQALITGVRLRLAEKEILPQTTSSPPEDSALRRLTSWLEAGRWLEATRDDERIAVTLRGYRYEQGDSFIREGSMSGMMTEIVGHKQPDLYPVRTRQRGFGTTFWKAITAAFASVAI